LPGVAANTRRLQVQGVGGADRVVIGIRHLVGHTDGEQKLIWTPVEGLHSFAHLLMHVHYKDGLGNLHSSYFCGLIAPERTANLDPILRVTIPSSHRWKEDM
jgi:hypothetical protein